MRIDTRQPEAGARPVPRARGSQAAPDPRRGRVSRCCTGVAAIGTNDVSLLEELRPIPARSCGAQWVGFVRPCWYW